MFVVTLNRKNLKTLGLGAMCCALVVCSALLGRYISGRTVTAGASVSGKVENAQDIQTWFTGYGLEVDGASITADKVKIRYISGRTVTAGASVSGKVENAQDIQTWFTGYGLEVDGASITADKVKIPRKWDDSFAAFNSVVQQSGLDLARYKGKTVEKWVALDLARYKGKTVEKWVALIPAASKGDQSSYGVLLVYKKKPVGAYLLQKPSGLVTGLKDAQATMAQQVSGEDFSGDWGERHDDALNQRAQQTSGEDFVGEWESGQNAQQTSGDFAGDWGERHDEALTQNAQQTSGEDFVGEWESGQNAQQTSGEDFVGEWESGSSQAQYTDLPLDAEGYPVD